MSSVTWSYSSLKTFTQCPKKYYHLRIVKDVKDGDSEALSYGRELHKVAEDYIKEGSPIPAKFSAMKNVIDSVKNLPGEKYCELKLGVKRTETGFEPCDFFDKDVWWRGIADLVSIEGDVAYSVDYKTSKNAKYADTKQLDVVAAALFTHFPQIRKIKSALLFVVSNEFVPKTHDVALKDKYFDTFKDDLNRLEAAQENGVWNAVSGPLCRFCPVSTCEHNRK
jgi:CRISPR/Cas system-associated exonuclease Cas4 (RecB family)